MWKAMKEEQPEEGVQILLKIVEVNKLWTRYTDCTRIANRLLAGCGVYYINSTAYNLYWIYICDLEPTLEAL